MLQSVPSYHSAHKQAPSSQTPSFRQITSKQGSGLHDAKPRTHNSSKVREISVADFFAQTITSVVNNESISDKWKSNQ